MTAKRRKSTPKKKTLKQLYAAHRGKVSDKWSSYLAEYEWMFAKYRDKPVRFLEIGVQNGGSLEIWSRYFHKARKIVGCDTNPTCAHLSYEDPRIAVVIGDANSDATEEAILGHAAAFDIIIDDGSHHSSDIVKSFARYFPHLVDGGVFVAEDLHCSYWREYEGGLYDPFSSMTFFKGLADIVNHEHWGIGKRRSEILKGFFSKYSFYMTDEAFQAVHSVQFINSLCVVGKDSAQRNRLNARVIVGSVAMLDPGIMKLHSTPIPNPDQTSNEWTARSMAPGEELPLRIKELAEREERIASLNQVVTEGDHHITKLNQTITERDERITTLNEVVAERDGQITSLTRAVAERDEALAAARQAAESQRAEIARFAETVQRLEHHVAERDGEIASLNQAVSERDAEARALAAKLEARDAELNKRAAEVKAVRQRVASLETQLTNVYASRSWRITAPLRAVSRHIRRVLGNT